MIELPDPKDAFRFEDGFLLTCKPTRIAKILALYEAYRLAASVPGAVIECGVFKGAGFSILAMLRSLLENVWMRPLIGFDTFDRFPHTSDRYDETIRCEVIAPTAGIECISTEQLRHLVELKGGGLADNIQLIPGDICETVPAFAAQHPELKIALLSIDVDFAEATRAILDCFFPRLSAAVSFCLMIMARSLVSLGLWMNSSRRTLSADCRSSPSQGTLFTSLKETDYRCQKIG